ncbi:general secretion pathway protein I [Sulfurifustis variabilis]|uniref:Type II secretion system protein I n=1 Tax=Sulfurifustis variabilis TaxID=1675686 RepID=A0A1B4V490_9GAMM|nr:type II secretion system minor pseudopilin GspI [Sulfurifustis variabilis]BAU48195.1 general secretion pathway protein I [Sulfurifustis variabilis]
MRPEGVSAARRGAVAGFTLVEVLVALAVLAIALAAVLHAIGQAIDLTAGLRDRTLALWLAEERAAMHQLKQDWPSLDTSEGTTEFAGVEWRWLERTVSTPVPDFRRMDIEIYPAGSKDRLATVALFLRKP